MPVKLPKVPLGIMKEFTQMHVILLQIGVQLVQRRRRPHLYLNRYDVYTYLEYNLRVISNLTR
jgi:hypothetical protein